MADLQAFRKQPLVFTLVRIGLGLFVLTSIVCAASDWVQIQLLEHWKTAPAPGIVNGWWALWLLTSFLSRYLMRVSFRAETIEETFHASWESFTLELLGVPLGVIAYLLLSKLRALQIEKHERLLKREGSTDSDFFTQDEDIIEADGTQREDAEDS